MAGNVVIVIRTAHNLKLIDSTLLEFSIWCFGASVDCRDWELWTLKTQIRMDYCKALAQSHLSTK